MDPDPEPPRCVRQSLGRLLPLSIPESALVALACLAGGSASALAAPAGEAGPLTALGEDAGLAGFLAQGIPWFWLLLGLGAGFLGSAFFTILDHAVFALEPEEIEALERNDPAKARCVRAARKEVARAWFTLLSGVLFFNLLFAFSTGAVVWRLLGEGGFAAVAALLTAITAVLFLGEVLPGLLAARWVHSLAPLAARGSLVFAPIFAPFSVPLLFLLRASSRSLKLDFKERERVIEVEKRLLALIGFGQVDVSLEEEEREMIEHALEFGTSRARDIMTPREKIAGLETSSPQTEALCIFRKSSCSRLLVYENTLDNVLGVAHRKQVLLNPQTDYHEMVTPAVFVTEDMELIEILALMKEQRRQIVVVLDQYGATVGVVSMDDLLRALVGPATGGEEDLPPRGAAGPPPAQEGAAP